MRSSFLFYFLFWNNHRFTGSCKINTNNSHVPFTQFSPVFMSYMVTEQFRNQEIGGGTMNVWTSVLFHSMRQCVTTTPSQDTGLLRHHRGLPLAPSVWSHVSLLVSTPWQCASALHLYNSVISVMLYKRNHTPDLLRLPFFFHPTYRPWFIQVVACISSLFLLLLSSIPRYGYSTVCLGRGWTFRFLTLDGGGIRYCHCSWHPRGLRVGRGLVGAGRWGTLGFPPQLL